MPATLPSDKRKLSPSNSKRPAQRRRTPPSRHASANSAPPTPGIQRNADARHPPVRQTQTQPLQSSSEALTTHNLSVKRPYFSLDAPAVEGDAVWLCFCRRGADSWAAEICVVLAEFRRPRSQPPTKPQTRQHPLPRRPVRPSAQKRRHPHFSVSPPESYTHFLYISP